MKAMKRLFLLISAVACLLVLAALHDWWENQYNTQKSYGRGIRRLSAIVSLNATTEQKSLIPVLTTRSRPTKKTVLPTPKYNKPNVISTSKKASIAIKKAKGPARSISISKLPRRSNPINKAPRRSNFIVKASRPPNSTSTHVVGPLLNINSSYARIMVANAILKSRPMKIIEKEKVVRILLVTYFRGGSTFLGDILQQNWKTFYHFEPLHYMSLNSRVKAKEHIREAFDVLSNLFRCNFVSLSQYVKWAMMKKHQFLIRRNHFLWALCRIHPSICFTSYYMKEICLRAPVQVMKITRLYLRDALNFINENSDLKIKLIYLTRDPRGIFSSRRVLHWCKTDKNCSTPESTCRDISSDVKYLRNNSTSFVWLRYEDLCLNSVNITKSMYKWLGVPYTTGVAKFLRSHTRAGKGHAYNPYSTYRNTSTVAFEWLHRLSLPEIEHVQSQCSSVMRTLGYKTTVGNKNITYYRKEIPGSVLDAIPDTNGVSVFRN